MVRRALPDRAEALRRPDLPAWVRHALRTCAVQSHADRATWAQWLADVLARDLDQHLRQASHVPPEVWARLRDQPPPRA